MKEKCLCSYLIPLLSWSNQDCLKSTFQSMAFLGLSWAVLASHLHYCHLCVHWPFFQSYLNGQISLCRRIVNLYNRLMAQLLPLIHHRRLARPFLPGVQAVVGQNTLGQIQFILELDQEFSLYVWIFWKTWLPFHWSFYVNRYYHLFDAQITKDDLVVNQAAHRWITLNHKTDRIYCRWLVPKETYLDLEYYSSHYQRMSTHFHLDECFSTFHVSWGFATKIITLGVLIILCQNFEIATTFSFLSSFSITHCLHKYPLQHFVVFHLRSV